MTAKPARSARKLSFAGSPAPGHRLRRADGYEIFHQASPVARRFWCYLRLVGRANVPPGWQHRHQGHDGFLLHFLLHGSLWHRVHEQTRVINPSEAMLMDLREDATYRVAGGRRAQFYWALFDGKDLPAVFVELRADRDPIFSKLDAARVQALFRELISLTERQPPAADVKIGSLLLALLGELFASRHYPVSLTTLSGIVRPYSLAVRKAIDRLTAYYDWPVVSVKDIASRVGQSLHYFTRRFHREVGMSPKAYLHQYRIEQAKSQLESSDKTIEQIARSVGFRDQNYFTRQFKKIIGRSPREYRRNRQKLV